MWKTANPAMVISKTPLSDYTEPDEVRFLKRQLANLECKCAVCLVNRDLCNQRKNVLHKVNTKSNKHDFSTDTINSKSDYVDRSNSNIVASTFDCPSCYLTMNLLKVFSTRTKTAKDEELETNVCSFKCDKAVESIVKHAEKSTSMTKRPISPPPSVSFSLFQDIYSDLLSDNQLDKQGNISLKRQDKRVHDKGTVAMNSYENCICLDSFMDSIRPPLDIKDNNSSF